MGYLSHDRFEEAGQSDSITCAVELKNELEKQVNL
jgi:hypothetical protein